MARPMPAVSLTDHGSMAGAVHLFKAAAGTGVKPIIGCEVYVTDDRHVQKKGQAHLTLNLWRIANDPTMEKLGH